MLDVALALALREQGLSWTPRDGDHFWVPDRDLDDEVFVLSHMVIEQVELPDGTRVLAFNGTTEWALDALEATEAVWLPREDQLRERLTGFERLELLPPPTNGFAVQAGGARFVDVSPENAYARALLGQLGVPGLG